jgi:protease IV
MAARKSRLPFLIALLIIASFGASLFMSVDREYSVSGRFGGSDFVGVIELYGVIVDSKQIVEQLQDFLDDDSIEAIVFRIDSPGGSVGPCQEIYSEILRARERKPIVSSMGSVAASGGYYVASATQKIFANPGTLTGSIGVIMEFVHVNELMKFARVDYSIVKSGKFKDTGSPFRPLNEEQRGYLQSVVDDVRGQFVADIISGRAKSLDPEQQIILTDNIEAIADGRIFTGSKAREYMLVDELGTLNDAALFAAKKAGILGRPTLIYPAPKQKKLIDLLVEQTASKIGEAVSQAWSHESPFAAGLYLLPDLPLAIK